MSSKRTKPADNTAAIAAQFGTSIKALRLYESMGLLVPPRTEAGWRSYGRAEIERLNVILSLKQLGLSLTRIGELIKAGKADLRSVLALQEQSIQEQRRESEKALALIKAAQNSLEENSLLSIEQLAGIVRATQRMMISWTPELEDIAKRSYTPQQMEAFSNQKCDPEKAAKASRAWAEFYKDLDAVMAKSDPLSDEGLAVARRMAALIQEATGGDRTFWNSAAKFWKEAVHDPRTAPNLPMTKAHYAFLAQSFQELRRRGELQPLS